MGAEDAAKTPGELALDGVLRAVGVHERMLESLRARTASVIAAAAISASFLGSAALGQQGTSCLAVTLSYLGILTFAGSILAAILVLWPRTDRWMLEVSPQAILRFAEEEGPLSEAAMRKMALETEQQLDELREGMKPLWNQFRVSIILLGAQIVLWLIAIGIEGR